MAETVVLVVHLLHVGHGIDGLEIDAIETGCLETDVDGLGIDSKWDHACSRLVNIACCPRPAGHTAAYVDLGIVLTCVHACWPVPCLALEGLEAIAWMVGCQLGVGLVALVHADCPCGQVFVICLDAP